MVGGEYDGDKNLLKYDELTRSRGLDTHVTWEATDYEVNERWDARKEAGNGQLGAKFAPFDGVQEDDDGAGREGGVGRVHEPGV
ncbi:MAG: hypothetical protein IPP09_05515 [Elusimicrobia bacterium]|nr:hypothetical protein [Elusimicrobiota bacterium]